MQDFSINIQSENTSPVCRYMCNGSVIIILGTSYEIKGLQTENNVELTKTKNTKALVIRAIIDGL